MMQTNRANVTEQNTPRFQVLSESEVKQIHASSMEVLWRTGVYIESDEALRMMEEGGCKVNGRIAKIPPGLIEWAIDSAPSHFLLFDRNQKNPLNVGGHNAFFGLGPTLLHMIDPDTGKRRKFKKSDTEKAAKLVDALPNIEWVMGYGTISDVDQENASQHEFEAMLRNTSKPLIIWSPSPQGVRDAIKMAASAVGGEEKLMEAPFIASYSEPISPLTQNKEAVEKLLLTADYGIPTIHTPIPQTGASAPVTLAGELVSTNAENMASIVISQLRKPGFPIIMGGVIGTMDMLQAQLAYGAPEMQLMLAATMDIAHYYQIPTWGTAGCTDSHLVDQQAAIEATQSVLYSALSGANLVHDTGYMASGTQGALEMIALVDEIVGYAKFITNGIRVDEETLAVDVMNQVGPGGEYLTSQHTFKHFREQLYSQSLMDRQQRDKWEESGSKTLRDRLGEKVQDILKNHQPQPLPKEALDTIKQVLGQYEKK
jgi:trimethylamine--corrinoid protein Co-methyltransferase